LPVPAAEELERGMLSPVHRPIVRASPEGRQALDRR